MRFILQITDGDIIQFGIEYLPYILTSELYSNSE
jgi:hypothetical protein